MKSRRSTGASLFAAVALIVAASLFFAWSRRGDTPDFPARLESERPPLMILTTLPIVFPEHLSLHSPPSPVREALDSRYRLIPISVGDVAALGQARMLLAVQPQAQPPEDLVALDEWVRRGGRILLLADPALEWPSELGLVDPARPPFTFADTGLLAHWGLRLQAPAELEPATVRVNGEEIATRSPGTLVSTTNDCVVASGKLLARCRLGRGRATVIADADFLASDLLKANGGSGLQLLLGELSALETDSSRVAK